MLTAETRFRLAFENAPIGMALFTTSIQVPHLLRIAAEAGIEREVKEGLSRTLVASIGPTTTETLEEYGIRVDFEPSHPRMGVLVQEAGAAFGKR